VLGRQRVEGLVRGFGVVEVVSDSGGVRRVEVDGERWVDARLRWRDRGVSDSGVACLSDLVEFERGVLLVSDPVLRAVLMLSGWGVEAREFSGLFDPRRVRGRSGEVLVGDGLRALGRVLGE
jgi:hypothetical protein